MKSYFIGIDIGTSSARAVLFDNNGFQVSIDGREYSLDVSISGMAELNPDQVFDSVINVLRNCIKKAGIDKKYIYGIGISCQMHSLMLVDNKGDPLSRLITWADNRSKTEADTINDIYNASDLYNRTGCRTQHPMYPLSKLLWFKKNDPELFAKCHKFITIKEYIIFKLYGEYVVDYTLASCQGYYNIHRQNWDNHILDNIIGITSERLSEVVECTYILKGFKSELESILGIYKDTPLIIGAGDGIMANIGCGVVDSRSFSSTVGTSGAIRTASEKPLLDVNQKNWCYSFLKDMWVSGGAINNGGLVLKWFRDEFKNQFEQEATLSNMNVYELFDRYASEINPGSDGLIFLPFLTGERSPGWKSDARGIMYGLSYSHGRKHMLRASMEGVMFRLYAVYEVISALNPPLQEASFNNSAASIIANGGYTKSDIWLQMQADIFNKKIAVSRVTEASALGAAYLAMYALGEVKDIKKLLPGMHTENIIFPSEENHLIYKKAYELSNQIYESIYSGIKSTGSAN